MDFVISLYTRPIPSEIGNLKLEIKNIIILFFNKIKIFLDYITYFKVMQEKKNGQLKIHSFIFLNKLHIYNYL